MRAAALLLALAGPAAAEVPDPGIPRGADRTARVERANARYALPVGPFGGEGPATLPLRGRVVWQASRREDGPGTAAAIEGYRARLEAMGFEEVFACRGEACGGIDFRLGVELLPAPAMVMDTADFAQLSMARGGERAAHVSVLVSRVLGALHVQTVTVVPGGEAMALADSPPAGEAPAIAMPGEIRALERRLRERGHVRVDGLDFETGGARIAGRSSATLDALARLLGAEDAPEVVIVGHSDNRGGLELNRELSRDRAEAVRAALVERGVPASRLSAEGVGFLAPVASNETEAGRARNRRVELVLR